MNGNGNPPTLKERLDAVNRKLEKLGRLKPVLEDALKAQNTATAEIEKEHVAAGAESKAAKDALKELVANYKTAQHINERKMAEQSFKDYGTKRNAAVYALRAATDALAAKKQVAGEAQAALAQAEQRIKDAKAALAAVPKEMKERAAAVKKVAGEAKAASGAGKDDEAMLLAGELQDAWKSLRALLKEPGVAQLAELEQARVAFFEAVDANAEAQKALIAPTATWEAAKGASAALEGQTGMRAQVRERFAELETHPPETVKGILFDLESDDLLVEPPSAADTSASSETPDPKLAGTGGEQGGEQGDDEDGDEGGDSADDASNDETIAKALIAVTDAANSAADSADAARQAAEQAQAAASAAQEVAQLVRDHLGADTVQED